MFIDVPVCVCLCVWVCVCVTSFFCHSAGISYVLLSRPLRVGVAKFPFWIFMAEQC